MNPVPSEAFAKLVGQRFEQNSEAGTLPSLPKRILVKEMATAAFILSVSGNATDDPGATLFLPSSPPVATSLILSAGAAAEQCLVSPHPWHLRPCGFPRCPGSAMKVGPDSRRSTSTGGLDSAISIIRHVDVPTPATLTLMTALA